MRFRPVELYETSTCIGPAHVYGLEGSQNWMRVDFYDSEPARVLPDERWVQGTDFLEDEWDPDRPKVRSMKVSKEIMVSLYDFYDGKKKNNKYNQTVRRWRMH